VGLLESLGDEADRLQRVDRVLVHDGLANLELLLRVCLRFVGVAGVTALLERKNTLFEEKTVWGENPARELHWSAGG